MQLATLQKRRRLRDVFRQDIEPLLWPDLLVETVDDKQIGRGADAKKR